MPSLWLGLRAAALYSALIVVATVWVFQIGQPPKDVVATLSGLAPFQFLAAGLCCVVIVRHFGWVNVGFGRLNWPALIWLLPSWIVLGLMYHDIARVLTLADFWAMGGGLALLIIVPFLIAFAEEVMFRGILLRSALRVLPLVLAMMLSAASFGILHLVNAIAGQAMAATGQQMAFALMAGFFLAPIAVRLGNLWPLIIWHWLWNMAVFASQMGDVLHPLAIFGIAIQTVISIGLWADMIRAERQS